MNTILSQTGIKIEFPDKFYEAYDSSLNIRKYGNDNLYPQHLREFFEASPTFNAAACRLREFLYGEGSESNLIDDRVVSAILRDYSIFGGFTLFVQYDGLGDVSRVNYIPFESIRLGEQGIDGIYTQCVYNPDWSYRTTVNKKKVTKNDSIRYWIFTDDINVRLQRMNSEDYHGGEVFYYSNSISYPTEKVRAVLNYVSAEVGTSNILYRDVRTNFLPSSVLAIPRQSDGDINELASNLEQIQGDINSFKILTIEYSSNEDKPEVMNLSGEDYTDRVLRITEECKDKIIKAYGQESFQRLEDGSLGFGSQAISEIYDYYNFQLKTQRKEILKALHRLDPGLTLKALVYPTDNIEEKPVSDAPEDTTR